MKYETKKPANLLQNIKQRAEGREQRVEGGNSGEVNRELELSAESPAGFPLSV